MENVKVLIVGSDANAYYMARCAHEAYGEKPHIISKTPWFFTDYSKIFTIEYHDDLWDEAKFVKYINDYAKKYSKYKILLVCCNDTYVEYLAKNQSKLNKNLYFAKHKPKNLETYQNKEKFYKAYENSSLDLPKTKYFSIKNVKKIPEMKFPIVLKPTNVIKYNHLSFKGKKKIYRLNTKEELIECVEIIKKSGYDDTVILQEYLEGDDTYMFDCVVYVDHNNKVTLQTFAQVGLQDQSAGAVGNLTCIINGYCSFKNAPVKETKDKIKKFFETHEYSGFANLDIKYDKRSNTFKILEINARQGRGSYYVAACGYNLIKVMVDDLIYKKKTKFKNVTKEQLLTYVPKNIVKKYIRNEKVRSKALELWPSRVNPLEYKKDNGLHRRYIIKKRQLAYYKTYKNPYWKYDHED